MKVVITDSGSLLDCTYYNGTAAGPCVDVVGTYYSDRDATCVSLPS